ncbi:hypothetical protein ACQPYK_37740 [Streptosporangium sp. CA-135522]|uniref:hypothetical protein n=1 Tax=Streptosporangium sp. CA-135522 TaxID=3240072 RepID=UPI003D8B46EA
MSAEVEIDYRQLRRSAEGIASAHARTQAGLQTFLEEMASYGQPWGTNNAVGQTIGMCYGGVHDMISDCARSNLDEYRAYQSGLRATVATYRACDQRSGENFDGLLA